MPEEVVATATHLSLKPLVPLQPVYPPHMVRQPDISHSHPFEIYMFRQHIRAIGQDAADTFLCHDLTQLLPGPDNDQSICRRFHGHKRGNSRDVQSRNEEGLE